MTDQQIHRFKYMLRTARALRVLHGARNERHKKLGVQLSRLLETIPTIKAEICPTRRARVPEKLGANSPVYALWT
jgi:hypothetical protein